MNWHVFLITFAIGGGILLWLQPIFWIVRHEVSGRWVSALFLYLTLTLAILMGLAP